MPVSANIIEDSISTDGIRLTTFELRYPRLVHSELMTHRVFSRNASSSRAVPSWRAIMAVLGDPAEPEAWGSNMPGMQAKEDLQGWRLALTKLAWRADKYTSCFWAWVAMKAGAHKQVVNRLTEAHSHISVVVTATDFANWFALRYHEDADPTIRELARVMLLAHRTSKPRQLHYNEWHLPYVLESEIEEFGGRYYVGGVHPLARASAARCARVSYLTHDGRKPDQDKDEQLYARLAYHEPMHASPLEHSGTPDRKKRVVILDDGSRTAVTVWENAGQQGNFFGWRQQRRMLPNDSVLDTHRKAA